MSIDGGELFLLVGVLLREEPLALVGPFCVERMWLCSAVDKLLAQRYTDVWLELADFRVREKPSFFFLETLYPSGKSPFS